MLSKTLLAAALLALAAPAAAQTYPSPTFSSAAVNGNLTVGGIPVSTAYNINSTVTCDGVTNVSTAFQTAINAAVAAGEAATWTGTCVVTNISIPSNLVLIGSSESTAKLLRPASDGTHNPVLSASGTTGFQLSNFTVDGNSGNETNYANDATITASSGNFILSHVTAKSAKVVTGSGGVGVLIQDTTDSASGTRSLLRDITTASNGLYGVTLTYSTGTVDNLTIDGWKSTGGQGLYSGFTNGTNDKIDGLNILNFSVDCGGGAGPGPMGMELLGYISGTGSVGAIYSFTNEAVWNAHIAHGTISNCPSYGLLAQIRNSTIEDVHTINSGYYSFTGGMVLNSYLLKVSDSSVDWVGEYGIDAGGCVECVISNNVVGFMTGEASESTNLIGLNVGGGYDTIIEGNLVTGEGTGIFANPCEADGAGDAFPWCGGGLTISHNKIICVVLTNCVGIGVSGGMSVQLSGNTIVGTSVPYNLLTSSIQWGAKNYQASFTSDVDSVTSASTLVIPDDPKTLSVTGTTTVNNILTVDQSAIGKGVPFVTLTAAGSAYTSAPAVSFTGGTCSVAPAATAFIAGNGVVASVQMTTFGTCTVTPTGVSFSGGGGSGAAASVGSLQDQINGRSVAIVPASGFTLTNNAGGLGAVFNRSAGNIATGAGAVYLYTNVHSNWSQSQ